MKKLMNDVANVLDESLDGFAAAHADLIEMDGDRRFLRRRVAASGKVVLVSGGGSGHDRLYRDAAPAYAAARADRCRAAVAVPKAR